MKKRKILIRYTLILIINLFVFLTIGYYLDRYFNTDWKLIILFLILSIVSLVILTQMLIRKNLNKLNKIIKNATYK